MRNTCRRYTILEVVIVALVIIVIAAIAIPQILGARKASHERAAIQYMKSWVSAQELYRKKHGVYADADEQLVREKFLTVTKGDGQGYAFALDNPPGSEWEWWGRGWPTNPGLGGDRYFFVDIRGQVRFAHGRQATKTDPQVGK